MSSSAYYRIRNDEIELQLQTQTPFDSKNIGEMKGPTEENEASIAEIGPAQGSVDSNSQLVRQFLNFFLKLWNLVWKL